MPEPAGSKAKFEGGTISKKVTHSAEPREIWRPLRGRQISRGSKELTLSWKLFHLRILPLSLQAQAFV